MKFYSLFILFIGLNSWAHQLPSDDLHWARIQAKTKEERTAIVNSGIPIEQTTEDYVVVLTQKSFLDKIRNQFKIDLVFPVNSSEVLKFPKEDEVYHDFDEFMEFSQKLAQNNKDIVSLEVIGKSLHGRDIVNLRISTDLDKSHQKPGIVFMGGHHAREHISVEISIKLADYLVTEFRNKNPEVIKALKGREIHIIPLVNPDGAEYDIEKEKYRFWRKNLSQNNNGSLGVDLNRNYGFKWGTGGSSKNPNSNIYRGPKPFSEPETQTIKRFVEENKNLTILTSFHSYSQLILYPWGHTYKSINNNKDFQVHKIMAETMAQWNGYKPQQSSDLYITSGDTTDWSYGVHKIISFTFELDPKNQYQGGFYPGDIIDPTFQKNIKPFLYMIDHADNPYRSLNQTYENFGLQSPLI